MRISKSFGSYNDRRYSKPWIAKVVKWPIGKYPELKFGGYVGDYSGGEVEIEAIAGDLLKAGQKDHRGNNTVNDFYKVLENGGLESLTQVEARKYYKGE